MFIDIISHIIIYVEPLLPKGHALLPGQRLLVRKTGGRLGFELASIQKWQISVQDKAAAFLQPQA